MSAPPITARQEETLATVAQRMLDHQVGSVLVLNDQGQLVGIVTEDDFNLHDAGVPFSPLRLPMLLGQWSSAEEIEQIYRAARQRRVSEIMQRSVPVVDVETPVHEIAQLMLQHKLKRLAVTHAGEVVGVITPRNFLRCVGPSDSAAQSAPPAGAPQP
jgi:CBS domain-containing protein